MKKVFLTVLAFILIAAILFIGYIGTFACAFLFASVDAMGDANDEYVRLDNQDMGHSVAAQNADKETITFLIVFVISFFLVIILIGVEVALIVAVVFTLKAVLKKRKNDALLLPR